jgi:hypothetical protein
MHRDFDIPLIQLEQRLRREQLARRDWPVILPGTPNRRRLECELAREQDLYLAGEELSLEREAARSELKKQLQAARRQRLAELKRELETPEEKAVKAERRKIFAGLRRLGFKREHVSGASAYYVGVATDHDVIHVRVSDHEVPYTADRERAVAEGGFSWAVCGWNWVLGAERDETAEEWLERLERRVRQPQCV